MDGVYEKRGDRMDVKLSVWRDIGVVFGVFRVAVRIYYCVRKKWYWMRRVRRKYIIFFVVMVIRFFLIRFYWNGFEECCLFGDGSYRKNDRN